MHKRKPFAQATQEGCASPSFMAVSGNIPATSGTVSASQHGSCCLSQMQTRQTGVLFIGPGGNVHKMLSSGVKVMCRCVFTHTKVQPSHPRVSDTNFEWNQSLGCTRSFSVPCAPSLDLPHKLCVIQTSAYCTGGLLATDR